MYVHKVNIYLLLHVRVCMCACVHVYGTVIQEHHTS